MLFPGLTEVEIDIAVSKASQLPPAVSLPAVSSGNTPPLPPRPLTPVHHPVQPPRTWSEYAIVAAVGGGVAYALVHFFKVSAMANGPCGCVILVSPLELRHPVVQCPQGVRTEAG